MRGGQKIRTDREILQIAHSKELKNIEIHPPLRWLMVTFSFPGSSTISIPNRFLRTVCASSKTALNRRDPCSPKTFALISVRRIGCREYSLANARRTIFLTITSTIVGASTSGVPLPDDLVSSESFGCASSVRRRWRREPCCDCSGCSVPDDVSSSMASGSGCCDSITISMQLHFNISPRSFARGWGNILRAVSVQEAC